MRIPTITALLSLVALFTFTQGKAVASKKTESLVTEKEEDLTSKSNLETSTSGEKNTNKNKLWQRQKNHNFRIPFIGGNIRFLGKPAQPELFSKPFYSGAPKKQNNQKNISQGSRGAEVWAVQRRLQARGFDPGAVDSVFGTRTKEAVKAFQKSVGLSVTGIVNEATWTALAKPSFASRPQTQREKPSISRQNPPIQIEKILAKGDKGSKVKTLQIRLETMGFNPGPIDGFFGRKTTGAVKKFQKYKGIKVSGIVDRKTWEAFSEK
ncbi:MULTISPECIES: peptidoglycan-binding domain-containing protein [Okeania]|uniref:Peptidoglycan-binding protein n=1 Tax=Okeania hirsuta TaxID=1458930 RepID=A0A3N6PSW9_9CYAN|nr:MULTISPECIES: peptidoglycan-binding protein [Okeania]NET77678.1 peptidoglycan-binding protein [Okeania sp. SIO1F9]RQH18886.1 peptidoglycan-binding protein [Okeania hirsuta]RQH50241.1 peptidoglycan-binding protein [Okeania hirsuta]